MKRKQDIFADLIEENQGIVHKVCRAYTNTEEEHKDLFQEIVLQLWKSYDSFKKEAKFSTWMYRVSLNTAITMFRKNSRTVTTTTLDTSFVPKDTNDYDSETEEQIQKLYAAIKKLSEVERALVLLYLDEKPYKEIADLMGISQVNARVKMNRVKVKLKELMK